MSAPPFEFGLDTFGDVTLDASGNRKSHAQVLRDVVEEAVVAEQAGIDAFDVGEHHRDDFSISAPEVVLSAIAARFSTLNAISNGRAEVIMGRGSFTESYPLGLSRFDLKYSNGALPHDIMVKSIELIGTRVVPRVKEAAASHEARGTRHEAL